MTLGEAIEVGIVIVNEEGNLKYNGMCKECKHSKCYAYPASSNMCMNENSEWHGAYHVDHNFMRYVNGCGAFEHAN